MITIKICASAEAREKGLFEDLAASFPQAISKDEPLTEKSRVTIPVLHITVPYEKASQVLQAGNNVEDSICKMSEQTIRRLPEAISEDAVDHLKQNFRQFFK